jgi:MarR family transcriptional regulator for hemolysin
MDQQSIDIATFFDLVSGIQIRARRTIESGLRARGLTYAQYSALFALMAKNGMSQAELAQALDTDSTTAMVLRTSLEKKGLVTRVDDPEDGRVKRIEISAAGKSALQAAGPETRNLHAKTEAFLSEAELKRMLPVLDRLHDFLGELASPSKNDGEPKRLGRPRKEGPKAKTPGKAKPAAKAAKASPKPKVAAKAKPAAKPVSKAKPAAKPLAKAKAKPKAK